MTKLWFIAIAAAAAALASLTFVQAQAGQEEIQAPASDTVVVELGPEGQPIAFPHDRHARDMQIDCQYCHFSVERSSAAGIPPVATCMGCHTFVAGTERPEEVERLRGFAERGEPIPWRQIYRVSDHVTFPHMRHVAAGVDCASCHGDVQEMGVIQDVEQPLTMGWCVNCHIDMGASRDCMVCHY